MPEKNKPVKLIKSSLVFKLLHRLPPRLNITEETNMKDVVLMCKSKEPNTTPQKSNNLVSQTSICTKWYKWLIYDFQDPCLQPVRKKQQGISVRSARIYLTIKFFGGVGNAI